MLIARATDRELARYLEFLKAENRILRAGLPARITVTPRECQRLLRFDRPLGPAIRDLITIVTPQTLLRWLQFERTQPARRPGRRQRRQTLVVSSCGSLGRAAPATPASWAS